MPGPKTIKFEIDPDGAVTLEGQNFTGAECDRHIRALAAALGTVETVKHKPEYTTHGTRQTQAH